MQGRSHNGTFSSAYLRYVLGLLFVVNVVNYMDRSIVGVLIEPMRADLALTDTQIGLMTGFAFSIFYAVAGIYLAHLADLHSRPRIISISIVAWGAMTALTGATQNFWQLLVTRVGVGVGEASVIPACNALLADYHRPERRPFALAVFTAGSMVGVMVGSMLGGAIAARYGWRMAFAFTGLAGVPLALVVWRTLREPGRGASDGVAAETAPVGLASAMTRIARDPVLPLLILSYAFLAFMQFGVITWFPAFLVRQYGLGLVEVGTSFGLALGAGTAIGSVLGGSIAGRLAARDMAWLTRLPMVLMLLLCPLYELTLHASSARGALVLVTVAAAIGGAAFGPILAAMQFALPAAIRAKGAALNGFIGSLIGMGGGPLLVGVLSDHYAPTLGAAAALQRGLAIAVMAALLGVVLIWLAHRRFEKCTRIVAGSSSPAAIATQ
jgi:predicted MFS family arabinose efflux permease